MINSNKFTPLAFLAALGAGGIAVSNFALINYTVEHGKGLIQMSQTHALTSGFIEKVYTALEINMALFTIIHLVLTIGLFVKLFSWMKARGHKEMIGNTLTNSAVVAPFISAAMTMNVGIASIRYFVPGMANNLQAMMLPALIVWAAIWVLLLYVEIKLLKISIISEFDTSKLNFGWLLQPFALAMVTVTGAGIAALAKVAVIANIAAFMIMVSGTMGLFLLVIKLMTIFRTYFSGSGIPEKQFLPSFLIVVPITTLYAISFFRFGHYLEHHQGAHLGSFFMIVMTLAFAFETWYLLFGYVMLKNYFKNNLRKEFHISQWGLICPLVAYSVLGAFVYKVFFANSIMFYLVVTVIAISSLLYLFLLMKQLKCYKLNTSGLICN